MTSLGIKALIQLTLLICVLILDIKIVEGKDETENKNTEATPVVGKTVQCGTYPLNEELVYELTSESANTSSCLWEFLGDSYCRPTITCSTFKIEDSFLCLQDSLSISDGFAENGQRYCGNEGPSYVISQTTILHVDLKATSGTHPPSFKCKVTCLKQSQQEYQPGQGYYGGYQNTQYSSYQNTYQNQNQEYPATWLPTTPFKRADCRCGIKGPLVEGTNTTTSNSGDASILIVGGTPAKQGEYRMLVAMVKGNSNNMLCGCTLFNSKYVLTAAHCCFKNGKKLKAGDISLLLNVYKLNDHDNMKTVRKKIVDIYTHPLYNPITKDKDYDVCVLQLTSPVNLKAYKEPIFRTTCLPPSRSYATFAGENATIAGWGKTSEGKEPSDVMLKATVPVITNEKCKAMYSSAGITITKSMVCAVEPKGGIDTCQGDSGGPIFVERYGKYLQIGVTSFGIGCARPEFPGVYARLTEVGDWVKMTARKGVWCEDLEDYANYGNSPSYSQASSYTSTYSSGSYGASPYASRASGYRKNAKVNRRF